jgi:hypothetical protein
MKNRLYTLPTIFLIACSMLMYEILLTRVCALRLLFHFGFLVVSNCLLGIGASGILIFAFRERLQKDGRRSLFVFTILYAVALALSYMFLLTLNIEQAFNLVSFSSLIHLGAFNLLAAVPFFFGGAVVGMLLTFNSDIVNRIYGLDLLGAGLGCLLCPLLLWKTGAGGTLVFLMLLAIAVTAITCSLKHKNVVIAICAVLGLLGIIILPRLDGWFPVPPKKEIMVSDKVKMRKLDHVEFSKWSASSRIDFVTVPDTERFILGYGSKFQYWNKLPPEKWINQDGSAGTVLVDWSEYPEAQEMLKTTLYSAAFMLKPKANVFIIGVGGGNDVWAAKVNGAASVTGVELNQQILDIHSNTLAAYSHDITHDPSIRLIHSEGRSALMRERKRHFDVIQMTGIDTWTSLTSGAYVLAENYLYTTEAFATMHQRLAENGILSVSRFAATMEVLRLFSNIYAALGKPYVDNLDKSLVCLGHDYLRTILLKKGAFTDQELASIDEFAQKNGFIYEYRPGGKLNNVVESFILSQDKAKFIRDFPRNITPTPDDRPYFFNYYKWRNPFAVGETQIVHPAVAQGSPRLIVSQLLLSILFSLAFIILPVYLFTRGKFQKAHLTRTLIYFTGLGMGFIAIEIVLMQKLVLFLGHPLYSISVTLFSMLIFAGLGSLISQKWFAGRPGRFWIVPVALTAFLTLFIFLSPVMVAHLIGLPTAGRILITVLVLAPISLILGVPFAYGIGVLDRVNPQMVPWAWAVNGSMSVIGSIATVVLSMNVGFIAVMIMALVLYFVSFLSIRKLA